jgi:hypothetical protein
VEEVSGSGDHGEANGLARHVRSRRGLEGVVVRPDPGEE